MDPRTPTGAQSFAGFPTALESGGGAAVTGAAGAAVSLNPLLAAAQQQRHHFVKSCGHYVRGCQVQVGNHACSFAGVASPFQRPWEAAGE